MYRLLDIASCKRDIKITRQHPVAVLDRENIRMAAVSRTGQLIYHNRAFREAFKEHLTEAKGLNLREALPDLWQSAAAGRGTPNGSRFKIINLLSETSDHVLGHLLVSVHDKAADLTERDLLHMLTDEDQSRFVDSYTGLYVADPQADTLKVNPAYEKIAFLPESDLVGRNLRELEERGYFSQSVTLQVLERLKKGEKSAVSFLQKIITGQEVVVTGKPLFAADGHLSCILTFVHDLLPLDKVACKLQELEGRPRAVSMTSASKDFRPGARQSETEAADFPLPTFDSVPVVVRDSLSFATLRKLLDAARYDSPILLCGETGVGKDMLAHYVHQVRARTREMPFVSVNCSAIPAELLESELFGYEEGAFSGAKTGGKPGLFEEAHGGTLFLNEIGEMPLGLQTKLLTVLDEERVRRLGGSLSKKVKTKIICATNRNLRRCVEEGSFRSDLYFRINVLEVNIPPIRERPRDILALVHHFMTQLCRQYGMKKYLCADVQDILLAYSWPGNIREIRNIVERLVVFSSTEQIAVGDLPPAILHSLPASRAKDNDELESAMTLRDAVKQFERRLIEQALAKYGTVADAATVLGIDPTTLGRKLKKP